MISTRRRVCALEPVENLVLVRCLDSARAREYSPSGLFFFSFSFFNSACVVTGGGAASQALSLTAAATTFSID